MQKWFILQVPFLRTGDGWSEKVEQAGRKRGCKWR